MEEIIQFIESDLSIELEQESHRNGRTAFKLKYPHKRITGVVINSQEQREPNTTDSYYLIESTKNEEMFVSILGGEEEWG